MKVGLQNHHLVPPIEKLGIKTQKIQDKRDEVSDVRNDSRTRLTIITLDKVLIRFNGPILQFSSNDPASMEPIVSLGPDALNPNYDKDIVMDIIKSKSKNTEMIIANALLSENIEWDREQV